MMDTIDKPKDEPDEKYQIHGQGNVLGGFVLPCLKHLGHEGQCSTGGGNKTDDFDGWHIQKFKAPLFRQTCPPTYFQIDGRQEGE